MKARRSFVCCIVPPDLLLKLLESKDKEIREKALNTLLATAQLRGERSVRATFGVAAAPADGRRTIFDCRNSTVLSSATVVRTEDGEASADDSVNRAFDGFGTTRDFYKAVFDRNSIDDHGMRLDGYVHRGTEYNNAFWDGQEMVFGDGDGVLFTDFTKSLDVIAHELTHGVTQMTANLTYHNQSGALNESISDVFGSLVKQWSLGQTADVADWLIGAEVFTPGIEGDALRSMKAPGTAYDNDQFGKDPQPDHMNKFVHKPDTLAGDWGGVHTNSGIPNKAFYLTAVGIGGKAWEAPGHIWYEALKASIDTTDFQDFADTTYAKAGQLYGDDSAEQSAVLSAWREVGIRISGVPAAAARGRRAPAGAGRDGDSLAALVKQIEALSAQVKALAKDVAALKGKK
jgi:Zn-dependent metalloprotease